MTDWIYGRNAVLVALASGSVKKLLVATAEDGALKGVDRKVVQVEVVGKAALDARFGKAANHQGIAAQLAPFRFRDASFLKELKMSDNPLIVVLDGLQDPHNFGAVARTAYAAGVAALVIRKDRQVGVTPAVFKASGGYVGSLPVVMAPNIVNFLKTAKQAGFWTVGLTVAAQTGLNDVPTDRPLCLVLGSEHEGLARLTAQNCDFTARIPLANGVESLNVSVAGGLAIYKLRGLLD